MSSETLPLLRLRHVRVLIGEHPIVRGVDLDIRAGEIHALMGPNGSGKSTLVNALMGHPSLTLEGEALLDGRPLGPLAPEERAAAGLFLAFQYPVAVPGVSTSTFLKAAMSATSTEKLTARGFKTAVRAEGELLGIPEAFLSRSLNDGLSGGEKKRLEMLQLSLLRPRLALVDEIDSGLDIDALRTVGQGLRRAADRGAGVLVVTHYQRLLDHVHPDYVHIFKDGRIESTGGMEQAVALEAFGYSAAANPVEVSP